MRINKTMNLILLGLNRFYSTSAALGDRNKGRLSIGDMVIEYAPF